MPELLTGRPLDKEVGRWMTPVTCVCQAICAISWPHCIFLQSVPGPDCLLITRSHNRVNSISRYISLLRGFVVSVMQMKRKSWQQHNINLFVFSGICHVHLLPNILLTGGGQVEAVYLFILRSSNTRVQYEVRPSAARFYGTCAMCMIGCSPVPLKIHRYTFQHRGLDSQDWVVNCIRIEYLLEGVCQRVIHQVLLTACIEYLLLHSVLHLKHVHCPLDVSISKWTTRRDTEIMCL